MKMVTSLQAILLAILIFSFLSLSLAYPSCDVADPWEPCEWGTVVVENECFPLPYEQVDYEPIFQPYVAEQVQSTDLEIYRQNIQNDLEEYQRVNDSVHKCDGLSPECGVVVEQPPQEVCFKDEFCITGNSPYDAYCGSAIDCPLDGVKSLSRECNPAHGPCDPIPLWSLKEFKDEKTGLRCWRLFGCPKDDFCGYQTYCDEGDGRVASQIKKYQREVNQRIEKNEIHYEYPFKLDENHLPTRPTKWSQIKDSFKWTFDGVDLLLLAGALAQEKKFFWYLVICHLWALSIPLTILLFLSYKFYPKTTIALGCFFSSRHPIFLVVFILYCIFSNENRR